ncbi:MAG: hypothetical protein Q8T09_00005 [Candidatus Melainabacteria bacterium]|nr:hypothetical protein [Candidatus Melainabacteria bacterium]
MKTIETLVIPETIPWLRNDLIEEAFEGQPAGYAGYFLALSPVVVKSDLGSCLGPNTKPDRAIVPPDGPN